MSVVLTKFLNWLDRVTDQQPLWVIWLTLLALSTGVWFLVVLGFVSIARSMT
jgi:hypothetical protein